MRTGAIVGAISGDVSGISFSNNRGSLVVRKKRRQTQLTRTTSRFNQSTMMLIRNAWAELSADNKEAWRSAAILLNFSNRLGIKRQISGYQYFMKYNRFKLLVAGGVSLLPFVSPSVGVSGVPTVTSTIANGIRIQFLDENVPPALEINVYGRNLFRDTAIKFSNARTFVSHFSPGIPADFFINTEWDNILGLPILNQFIYLRIVLTDSANFQPHNFYDVFAQTTA